MLANLWAEVYRQQAQMYGAMLLSIIPMTAPKKLLLWPLESLLQKYQSLIYAIQIVPYTTNHIRYKNDLM